MSGTKNQAAGAVYWLTGLSGSGKTTMSTACVSHFRHAARHVIALDGDVLRNGLCRDLGFSDTDRSENVRRAAEVAKLMADTGTPVLVALISPYQSDRDMACRIIGAHRFHEIHLAAPVAVCEARDVKGLYAKARRGDIPGFTGISAPYEPPHAADLVLETGHDTVEACTGRLIAYMCRHGV